MNNSISFDLKIDRSWDINTLTYNSKTNFDQLILRSGVKILSTWPYFLLQFNVLSKHGRLINDFLPLYLCAGYQSEGNGKLIEKFLSAHSERHFPDGLQLEFVYLERPPNDVNVYASLFKEEGGFIYAKTISLQSIS